MTANIFITGTSSGIGHALAKSYLESGANVFGISRRTPEGLTNHPRYRHAAGDLGNFENVPSLVRELFSGVQTLDLIVLNAAVLGRIADLAETSVFELKQTMDVNVWSNKVLLDEIFTLGLGVGQVVAISSGAASSANRGWNGYSISKAALNMLVGLYAAERPDTHFASLAPGIVDTRMQEYLTTLPEDERFGSVDFLREARGTPMMPKPDDAAQFLVIGIERLTKEPSGTFTDITTLLRKH